MAVEVIAVVLATAMLAAACGGAPRTAATTAPPPSRSPSAASTPSRTAPPVRAAAVGTAGTYRVGERRMTFTEPAHVGVTGQHVGERSVLTLIRYPVARGPSGSWPAARSRC